MNYIDISHFHNFVLLLFSYVKAGNEMVAFLLVLFVFMTILVFRLILGLVAFLVVVVLVYL